MDLTHPLHYPPHPDLSRPNSFGISHWAPACVYPGNVLDLFKRLAHVRQRKIERILKRFSSCLISRAISLIFSLRFTFLSQGRQKKRLMKFKRIIARPCQIVRGHCINVSALSAETRHPPSPYIKGCELSLPLSHPEFLALLQCASYSSAYALHWFALSIFFYSSAHWRLLHWQIANSHATVLEDLGGIVQVIKPSHFLSL